jgi:hypothetical protein
LLRWLVDFIIIIIILFVHSSCEETQIVTPINISDAPNIVWNGFSIGSPNNELVKNENNNAIALHIGTAIEILEFANKI